MAIKKKSKKSSAEQQEVQEPAAEAPDVLEDVAAAQAATEPEVQEDPPQVIDREAAAPVQEAPLQEDPPQVEAAPEVGVPADKAADAPSDKKYVVKRGKLVSLRGGMTMLAPGKVLSEASYGKNISALLTKAGVEFEEV